MSATAKQLKAPFPYFGGKRDVAQLIWKRFGRVKHYIEPFCGSAAVLLAAPEPASLEVVGDMNGFIANFWRAVKHQPGEVAREADYPVSHIDLGARHRWLMGERDRVGAELQDPLWPGDARVAGWWLWGQCCWIGSGWCEWLGQVPHAGNAGRGIQAIGQVPHAGNAGMGIQAIGQVPHIDEPGRGFQSISLTEHAGSAIGRGMKEQKALLDSSKVVVPSDMLTSCGRTAWRWLHELAARLERVRVVHGEWDRCLNNHYGGNSTAVFLDPPYRAYEALYGSASVADAVEAWARENGHLRVVLAGHRGDYPTLAGWSEEPWTRKRLTYSGSETTDSEALWFSPACLPFEGPKQRSLFG